MRAAVIQTTNQERVDVRDDVDCLGPDGGEVRVRIRATGVCHSDLSGWNGTLPQPPPFVMGHEAAGEVIAVGPGVDGIAEGDHVVVAWTPPCWECPSCRKGKPNLCLKYTIASIMNPRFRIGDAPIFGMAGIGTFVEEVTLPRAAVVKIEPDVPFEIGALIGCAITTGIGSVFNVAKVQPGDSVAVIGCGGVGIAVIQGARIAGAGEIVAIDMVDKKLEWAKQFGATRSVKSDEAEAAKNEVTAGDGFDHVFEVVGRAATIRQAYDLTRRGGQTIVVGVGGSEEQFSFTPFEFFFNDRQLKPSVWGDSDVRKDFHRMLRLWRSGQLDLEGMITNRLELEDINDAFDAMKTGEVIRQVITF